MTRSIKVLHLTTHNEECGIARYQEQFVEGMLSQKDIKNIFFDVSPNVTRFMTTEEYQPVLDKFSKELDKFDILHIQHELSFYKHKELKSIINLAHNKGKKVIVTIHTALDVEYKKAHINRSIINNPKQYLRDLKSQKKFESIHLNPLKKADLVLVHNKNTKQSLINHGFKESRVVQILHPVPKISFKKKTNSIKKALNYKTGDVIFCNVGFISKTKGTDQSIQALSLLPDNYKLAIIGGLHPKGTDDEYLVYLKKIINDNNLQDRVTITGFIQDDDLMNAMIRECDIAVYPYDSAYYSYVSSGALHVAIANNLPIIAYPTKTFLELNDNDEVVVFCEDPDYVELAKLVKKINIKKQKSTVIKYAEQHTYDIEAKKLAKIYRSIVLPTS